MKKLVIFLSFATLLFAEGSVEQKHITQMLIVLF